ncbi:MAG: hypothetical protein KC492_17675 [Myxococcales bacterium]|nr:hypothetical protein [Myxococcales bacterium]
MNEHLPSPMHARLLAFALLTTVVLGVWLRWFLAGTLALPMSFTHLRHAHSHLGYFGLLFPLAWIAWRRLGAPAPQGRALAVYATATLLAFVGFLRAGYGPEAIVGSTVVGAVWLGSAWRTRAHLRSRDHPLAPILPGVIVAEACIPPIAILLRRQPDVAAAFVATFLAALLFAVLVPSALAACDARLGSWPLFFGGAIAASAAIGVWDSPLTRVGMSVYALMLGRIAWRMHAPISLRGAWGAVSVGVLAMALGILPNVRPVAIGAIHFMILGPVLASLAPHWLRWNPPEPVWLLSHGSVAVLAGALVAQGLGFGSWTAVGAALGGSGVALFWVLLIGSSWLLGPRLTRPAR